MKLRLETLKACHGHVRERRVRERSDRHRRRLKRTVRRAKRIAQYDGPQEAFRKNCSDSFSMTPPISILGGGGISLLPPISGTASSTTTVPKFIDPKLILAGKLQTDLRDDERQNSESLKFITSQTTAGSSMDAHLVPEVNAFLEEEVTDPLLVAEAQFVNSSITTGTNSISTLHPEESIPSFDTNLAMVPEVTDSTSMTSSHENAESQPAQGETALHGLIRTISKVDLQSSMTVYKNNIASRAEHTASVSQFSGAPTGGSSLMSWATRLSSGLSFHSSSSAQHFRKTPTLRSDVETDMYAEMLSEVSALTTQLSALEEDVWIDLVGTPAVSAFSSLSPNAMPCCGLSSACNSCGLPIGHLEHGYDLDALDTSDPAWSLSHDTFIDHYGNTPFHVAGYESIESLMTWRSARLSTKQLLELSNTLGETALHMLKCSSFTDLCKFSNWLTLLNDGSGVADRKYLNKRDCHGRTIIHRFILQMSTDLFALKESVPLLSTILEITRIPSDAADNQGKTIFELLSARGVTGNLAEKIIPGSPMNTLESYINRYIYDARPYASLFTNYTNLIYANPDAFTSVTDELLAEGLDIDWVDRKGDTILIALVKCRTYSNPRYLKDLINRGANFSIKDRKGNTSLGLAVCSGFLASTLILLNAGANVHSRNYTGVGILLQAAEKMRLAKQAKDYVLENKILSCTNLLIDRGAVINPTDIDEWMTPEGRAKRQDVDESGSERNGLIEPSSWVFGEEPIM
jgi:hypothetical protein